MKILSVQFSNINSLKGEWKIDFTESPFSDNALFAITGPTGAGKTTILDAICLALYHKTPRIKVVSSSSNELMTRGTGECSAEVVFAVKSVEYIASWSMKRARGKADGKLQGALVSLANRGSGEIIASQIKPKLESIESLTGLDFERFTKSMLLSQGDFAAFLNAEENERAELLEELTGTEIYGLISQQVHQQFSEAKQKKELLAARSNGIELLSESQTLELDTIRNDNESRTRALQKEKHSHLTNVHWWQGLYRLTQRLDQAMQAKSQAQQEVDNCAPIKQQLAEVEQAKQLQPLFDNRSRLEVELKQVKTSEEQLNQQLSVAEQARPQIETQLTDASQALTKNRDALEHFESHIVSQVAPLDKQIDLESQQLVQTREKQNELLKQQSSVQQQVEQLRHLEQQNQQEIDRVKRYQLSSAQDQLIEQNLPLWQHQITQQQQLMTQHHEHEAVVGQHTEQQKEATASLATKQSVRQELTEKHQPAQRSLDQVALQIAQALSAHQGDVEHLHLATETARQIKHITSELQREQTTVLTVRDQLHRAQRNVTDFSQQQQANKKQRDELVNKYRELDKHVIWLNKIVSQAETIALLRSELTSDQPCVVCGSEQHKTVQSDNAELLDEQQQLKTSTKQLGEVTEQGQSLREQQAVLQQKIENEQQLAVQLQAQYDEGVSQWQQQLTALAAHVEQAGLDLEYPQKTQQFLDIASNQFEQLNTRYSAVQTMMGEQRQLQIEMQNAAAETHSLDSDIRTLETQLQTSSQRLDQSQKLLQQCQQELDSKAKELTRSMSGFAENKLAESTFDFTAFFNELTQRNRLWRDNELALAKANEALQTVTKKLEQHELNVAQWNTELNQLSTVQTQKQLLITELGDKRYGLLQQRKIEDARLELKQAVVSSEQLQAQVSLKQRECDNQLTQWKTELSSITNRMNTLVDQHHQALEAWNKQLQQSIFDSEVQFERATQWYVHAATWRKQLADSEQALLRTQGEWSAIDKQLQEQQTLKPAEIPEQELCQAALSQCEQQLESIQEEMGEIKNRLEMDRQNQQKSADLMEEIQRFNTYYNDIAYLHGLIGSSSGDKFRKFAQSLTLDNLVYLANQRLAQLHGRYRLKRNHNTDLQFNVIDSWQADVERDTKTLSGGESFLVSLALALALSDLVSHKTSIDSLFLDEGFGTLDSETLDVALDALDNLQTSGKMIGVISHIDALKERIPTQIVVSKKSGLGVSELASRYRVAS